MRLTRRALMQSLAALLAARPGLAAPAPAARPFLSLAVAGTGYHGYATVAGALRAGEALALRREPSNPHDPNAVEVQTASGVKLGYVPRRAAGEVAARLDRGEEVRARVTGFLPTPAPGERFVLPEGLVRTWANPGEPVVELSVREGAPSAPAGA